jgi:hypothetical protein
MTIRINSKTKRREFLKGSMLASIGLMMGPLVYSRPLLSGFSQGQSSTFAIAPLALLSDLSSLVHSSSQFHPAMKSSLVSDFELDKPGSNDPKPGNTARLAGVRTFGKTECTNLLQEVKDQFDEIQTDIDLQHRLAFALGWLGFASADRHFQGAFGAQSTGLPTDQGMQYDAIILKANAPSAAPVDEDALNALFLHTIPRTLTRFHTLIPDYDEVYTWLDNMAEWRSNLEVYYGELAKAYVNVSLEGQQFYDLADPIINSANTGKGYNVKNSAAKSTYGKALAATYHNYLAVNDFLTGKSSLQLKGV